MRRKYTEGRCEDCGWIKRVTWITFWVNAMRYRVCAACIKPYRRVILTGVPQDRAGDRPLPGRGTHAT